MHHTHAVPVCFLGEQAVLHEFLRKEYHVVHASVEETGQCFTERVLCLDNGLMVPNDNGMSIEP